METLGVRQFRDNLSRILKRVEQGEVIRVIRHGKDIVELRPIEENMKQAFLDRLKDKDISRGGIGKICPVKTVKNLRPDMPVSDFVVEDRR